MALAELNRVGVYLASLQLFFTLTWTVYVIFLPALAAQVGIRPQAVILILMLDQVIFAVMDWLMGQMADRVSKVVGRLSKIVATTTGVSCVAFLLLPFVAPTGNETLFIVITIIWSASSSVLRAPPLALLGKYAAWSAVPWLASLSMFGLGVAGAVSPYLTVTLREMDPRVPFALASVALLIFSFGLGWRPRRQHHRCAVFVACHRHAGTHDDRVDRTPQVTGLCFDSNLVARGSVATGSGCVVSCRSNQIQGWYVQHHVTSGSEVFLHPRQMSISSRS